MALNVVNLEYVDPPDTGPIFGVPIATVEQAIDLWIWAAQTPGYICTITARADGSQWIQIEGVVTETVIAQIGGDRWIVMDGGKFILFETAQEALAIYKVVP